MSGRESRKRTQLVPDQRSAGGIGRVLAVRVNIWRAPLRFTKFYYTETINVALDISFSYMCLLSYPSFVP